MQSQTSRYFASFKIFSIMMLVALAIFYAAVISITNWTGIGI